MAEKLYRVFVSSTYEDLKDERRAVMEALLQIDCIPAGMELFSAENESQWQVITKTIDLCDCYVLILGGRYGSCLKDGTSFTKKEYKYAVRKKKPVFRFLHANPKPPDGLEFKEQRKKDAAKLLKAFRSEVSQDKQCNFFNSTMELAAQVIVAITKARSNGLGVGYVRASDLKDYVPAADLLAARTRIGELEGMLAAATNRPPPSAEGLAKGADTYDVDFAVSWRSLLYPSNARVTSIHVWKGNWNQIFFMIGLAIYKNPNNQAVSEYLGVKAAGMAEVRKEAYGIAIATIADLSFQKIRAQLSGLGLVTWKAGMWGLTALGEQKLNAILVEKKQVEETAEKAGPTRR